MPPRPQKMADAMRSSYETERVGERLRELRLGRKYTISRLAGLSNVPASTISKIENGQLRPSLVHAINLASALQENLGFPDCPLPRTAAAARGRAAGGAGHDLLSGDGIDPAGPVGPLPSRGA